MSIIVPTDPPSGNSETVQNGQFLKIPFAVLLSNLTAEQKIVYSMIASWNAGECRYSFDYFSRALSSSDRTAIRVINSLIEKGLVEVTKRVGKSSIYKALPLDPCQIVTPDKLSPLTNCHPTPDKLSPLPLTNCHPIRLDIRSKDKNINPATEAASIVDPLAASNDSPSSKKQRKAPRPFQISEEEKEKLIEYLKKQAQAFNLYPRDEGRRIEAIIESCRAHHADKEKKRADWCKTVRNWIDKEIKWGKLGDWKNPSGPKSDLTDDQLNRLFRRILNTEQKIEIKPDTSFAKPQHWERLMQAAIMAWGPDWREEVKKFELSKFSIHASNLRSCFRDIEAKESGVTTK
jgi:hypothetical protein